VAQSPNWRAYDSRSLAKITPSSATPYNLQHPIIRSQIRCIAQEGLHFRTLVVRTLSVDRRIWFGCVPLQARHRHNGNWTSPFPSSVQRATSHTSVAGTQPHSLFCSTVAGTQPHLFGFSFQRLIKFICSKCVWCFAVGCDGQHVTKLATSRVT
jgi:hypothetical protein